MMGVTYHNGIMDVGQWPAYKSAKRPHKGYGSKAWNIAGEIKGNVWVPIASHSNAQLILTS